MAATRADLAWDPDARSDGVEIGNRAAVGLEDAEPRTGVTRGATSEAEIVVIGMLFADLRWDGGYAQPAPRGSGRDTDPSGG